MPLFPNYSSCPWTLTSLSPGPLVGHTYECNITSLSASTIYEYRAYSVINGEPYYGNIRTGCTLAISTTVPTVNTGCATCVTDSSMRITGNTVTNKGGLCIAEYGVLYTQNAAYGNTSCMVYEAVPAKICKKCISADIAMGATFFTTAPIYSIIGLSDSDPTYYRAFARNACGSGYGTIKTQTTCSLPPPPSIDISVQIRWIGFKAPNEGFGGIYGLYCCNGSLLQSCKLAGFKYYSSACWTAPATGCYYVDFSGLLVYDNGCAINPYYINWSDCYDSGLYRQTSCFSGNNNILVDISNCMPLY